MPALQWSPRVFPPQILLVALVVQAAVHFVLPLAYWIAVPWNWLGAVPALAGIGIVLHSANLFSEAKTTILPGQESSVLVTSGFFRFTRNPMYLGMVLLLTGAAFLFGSAAPWLIVIAFAAWIDRAFIRREEMLMLERFGETYAAYCARVRRWF